MEYLESPLGRRLVCRRGAHPAARPEATTLALAQTTLALVQTTIALVQATLASVQRPLASV